MKALLLSAYDAESHRLWRENLKAMFPLIEWTELILPARYFPWRVRGNSLSWAFNHRATLTDNHDLLLCTSMTDLSALRGFVPALARIPNIVYFHENQFAYPANPDPLAVRTNPVEPQMLSLYSALCADQVIFNSDYNRSTFLSGVQKLLGQLPDHVPTALLPRLQKATVIPVPLREDVFDTPARQDAGTPDTLDIVWNHRHEFDKGPALLLAIVQELVARKLRFRLHALGQRFRRSPPEFAQLQHLLAEHCTAMGITPGRTDYVADRREYCRILADADVVLSTALHDFQGLSILEATALGCTPLAPARLVYPEYLPAACLYQGNGEVTQQAASAVQTLLQWAHRKRSGMPLLRVDVAQFRQSSLQDAYSAVLSAGPGQPALS